MLLMQASQKQFQSISACTLQAFNCTKYYYILVNELKCRTENVIILNCAFVE